MNPATEAKEDPLIAALPPATDYMTYLTLLEYQLRPENLSTLNRLLSEDDGTLAAEIGWDLLRLVLPMLQIIPEEASKCLSLIARRGNPREVVVRVAEELERIGQQEDTNEDEADSEQEDLPTFAGEAPRIHLGEMKLDGMPVREGEPQKPEQTPIEPKPEARRSSLGGEYGSDNILILQGLLSMLSILHPRIKTQYPSRFLATSLPAALGAYRSLNITVESTSAFIDFLSKMSGKQRPALPPRTSTQSSIPMAVAEPVSGSTGTIQAPPLPDPEAKTDLSSRDTSSQSSEKAITQRLLQAVMLELLDEYTGSFQTTQQPSMSWTVRLREKHEPKRVLPGRPTETQRWAQSAELKSRDEVLAKFLKLSKDLNLDAIKELGILTSRSSIEGEEEEEFEQPESDYPTSPSQIPFPTSGVVLLFAAQNFAQDTTGLTSTPPLPLPALRKIFTATFGPTEILPHLPSLSQTDALLSLIYMTLQSPLMQPTPLQVASSTVQTPSTNVTVDLPFLTNLTNLFTTSPDPFVRDSTHHLTTILLHHHTTPETKLLYIKSLLSPHLSPASPIHEIQQGNLRALAINWLKDEFLSYHSFLVETETSQPTATTSQAPTQPPSAAPTVSAAVPGLDPNLMHTDPDLVSLVFPELPIIPDPFITSQPAASTVPTTSTALGAPQMSTEADLEKLLLQVPSFVASLNLICILASFPSTIEPNESILSADPDVIAVATAQPFSSAGSVPSPSTSTTPTTSDIPPPNPVSSATTNLLHSAALFVKATSAWNNLLAGFAKGIAENQVFKGKRLDEGEVGPVSVADVYALEDAVGRARTVMEAVGE